MATSGGIKNPNGLFKGDTPQMPTNCPGWIYHYQMYLVLQGVLPLELAEKLIQEYARWLELPEPTFRNCLPAEIQKFHR